MWTSHAFVMEKEWEKRRGCKWKFYFGLSAITSCREIREGRKGGGGILYCGEEKFQLSVSVKPAQRSGMFFCINSQVI